MLKRNTQKVLYSIKRKENFQVKKIKGKHKRIKKRTKTQESKDEVCFLLFMTVELI